MQIRTPDTIIDIGDVKNSTAGEWHDAEGYIVGMRFMRGNRQLDFLQFRLITEYERNMALTDICEVEDSKACPAKVNQLFRKI